jgi:predicted O-methyltransferase YrrM
MIRASEFPSRIRRAGQQAAVAWRAVRHGEPPWPGFGEPFNGQQLRLKTVRALIDEFEPDAFVETGTFLGFTTRFFSGNGLPVHTVEVKPSFYLAAKVALGWQKDVNLIRNSSPDALAELVRARTFARPLAYLDAHWWNDLPLQSEVDQLLDACAEAVIVVDDCVVPGDEGYGYDHFLGTPLSVELLDLPDDALVAYPAGPATSETGSRRGTLYIARGEDAVAAFRRLEARGLLATASASAPAVAA